MEETPSSKPAAPARPAGVPGVVPRKKPVLADAETHGLSTADKAAYHARKLAMDLAARREARRITLNIVASFAVMIVLGALFVGQHPKPGGVLFVGLLVLLLADLAFIGYIASIIIRHWREGKAAVAKYRQRVAAVQAARTAAAPAVKPSAPAVKPPADKPAAPPASPAEPSLPSSAG